MQDSVPRHCSSASHGPPAERRATHVWFKQNAPSTQGADAQDASTVASGWHSPVGLQYSVTESQPVSYAQGAGPEDGVVTGNVVHWRLPSLTKQRLFARQASAASQSSPIFSFVVH